MIVNYPKRALVIMTIIIAAIIVTPIIVTPITVTLILIILMILTPMRAPILGTRAPNGESEEGHWRGKRCIPIVRNLEKTTMPAVLCGRFKKLRDMFMKL